MVAANQEILRMHAAGIVLYFFGLAFSEALRLPHRLTRRQAPEKWTPAKTASRASERFVLVCIVIGLWMVPLVYAFTRLLHAFDYTVPQYAVWCGIVLFVGGLGIRFLAHRALAGFWSGTVELREGHRLVTHGIYNYIRHPIYTSLILWAVAQPLLLTNAVAGWSGFVAVALLWLVRVPREEAMMRREFGAEYQQYAARTGRIVPRLRTSAQ
jgi:protein-S-isoprenylcysteine O-methyltransferase Ste14